MQLIAIKVQTIDGTSEIYRLGRFMPLKESYCMDKGVATDSIRLFFDGYEIKENDTADSLQLEDQDQIDMVNEVEQHGDGPGVGQIA
ncbi:uncharacterized protein Dwil_GK27361 [Drosophila willistoni]|uniref:Ubiquitin-like domain-containing protein n=1 Tax=Drosophila willistoni TaxID=7260 RepID=A0A0Q9WZI2_DROWI|nr:small ubiquitin-related modifier 3 [Drosophila willistoni]KRF97579.1 uncharacterized protein Dwil_GK27361 [Drosophila willistoni]